jgi:phospholipase/lecithinase/hemolysin
MPFERNAQAKRLARAKAKHMAEQMAAVGIHRIEEALQLRVDKRENCPERSVTEAKDVALRLINQQLWNLEGIAETQGFNADEEVRLLKLLAGLNAALPKAAESTPVDISKMDRKELEEYARNKGVK